MEGGEGLAQLGQDVSRSWRERSLFDGCFRPAAAVARSAFLLRRGAPELRSAYAEAKWLVQGPAGSYMQPDDVTFDQRRS